MGLIDRQQADARAAQLRDRIGLGEPLGRHIDETQSALRHIAQNGAGLFESIGGIEARSRDPVALELGDLVAHQRDQRRHHNRQPVAQQRRQLVAQRLTAAGRHHRKHVAPAEDRFDDLGLAGPELRKAEHAVQQVLGGGKIGGDGIAGRRGGLEREVGQGLSLLAALRGL